MLKFKQSFKQSVKNLGFALDCHLTMNAHVCNIARTCYFELHRLTSIRRLLTSTATATLVSAFVLPRIDYCSSLLFGSTHDVTSHLQRIQVYAARVILRLPKSSSMTTHLISLHWLPVKVRSTYKIACLCYCAICLIKVIFTATDKTTILKEMYFTTSLCLLGTLHSIL